MPYDPNAALGLPPQLKTPPKWQRPHDWPTPKFTGDQIADFIANSLDAAQSTAERKNNDGIRDYYLKMDNFYVGVNAGKLGKKWGTYNPPSVPFATIVIGDDVAGYSYLEGAGAPVCNPLPLPADRSYTQQELNDMVGEGHASIGTAMTPGAKTGFFHAGIDDTVDPGVKITGTSADGVSGDFIKRAHPLANLSVKLGWYEKVG